MNSHCHFCRLVFEDNARQRQRKRCSKCKLIKGIEEFHKNKAKYDGATSECKQCNKANAHRYLRVRRDNDPLQRIKERLRSRLYQALKAHKATKADRTMELTGCTVSFLRSHLEAMFTPAMTWSNIHIDHIKPLAAFDLQDVDEQRRACHHTNLQPLLAADNMAKSDLLPDGTRARDIPRASRS